MKAERILHECELNIQKWAAILRGNSVKCKLDPLNALILVARERFLSNEILSLHVGQLNNQTGGGFDGIKLNMLFLHPMRIRPHRRKHCLD